MRDKRNHYRIVFCGFIWEYNLQVKRWWWPFFTTIRQSDYVSVLEEYAKVHANKSIVQDLGRLP